MESNVENQYVIANPGHRIGAFAVDVGFSFVTLGIGWFIWSLATWANGQTPGKQLLKLRVLDEKTHSRASWGRMCIRQMLIPATFGVLFYGPTTILRIHDKNSSGAGMAIIIVTFVLWLGVEITDFVWLFGTKRKRLVDYWAKTMVVNEAVIH